MRLLFYKFVQDGQVDQCQMVFGLLDHIKQAWPN